MDLKKYKVLGHDRNRARQSFSLGSAEHEVAELCYQMFLELTGVAFSAINRAYSRIEREKNPKVFYLWASGHEQAKEFLTRYKNLVKDAVIPLVKLKKHKADYDDSQDQHTQEFKKLIIDNNFFMLYSKLKDFGPFLLPEEHLEAYYKVLDTTYHSVKERLLANLAPYEAEGILKNEEVE